MSDVIKILGVVLIADGIGSIMLDPTNQIGIPKIGNLWRLIRSGIGLYLVVKG